MKFGVGGGGGGGSLFPVCKVEGLEPTLPLYFSTPGLVLEANVKRRKMPINAQDNEPSCGKLNYLYICE